MNKLIGLVDVDAVSRGKVTHPNLSLMKLSAWHKAQGDTVAWYDATHPLIEREYDTVYLSKVFSDEYTRDYTLPINAHEIIKGGSGYAIKVENGREVYRPELDPALPYEIEHIMPDYSIYPSTLEDGGHAYGYTTRGCPRGCDFCHIAGMQGRASHLVAPLSEFWNGQEHIHLCDPNVLACRDWRTVFEQLIKSEAYVDFNQGLDVRLMSTEKAEALNRVKYEAIHFAWDKPEEDLRECFERIKREIKRNGRQVISCYVLCNNGEPFEDDVMRVEFLKSLDIQPYVMIYRESTAERRLKRLKRYANNPYICWAVKSFDEYNASYRSERYGKNGMKHKEAHDWNSEHK